MKTLVQLLIVALVINAGARAGLSYYHHHDFQRDVHMETLNGGRNTSDELTRHILSMAERRGYTMTWDDVTVGLTDDLVTIDMRWIDNVELVPRLYVYPWPYAGRVQVKRLKPMKLIE